MAVTRGLGFLGRTRERRRLDGMLAQARAGQSAVIVIRGEPGIGKTALLRHAARQAAGLQIREVEGVEAEMELPFAGIHRLCAPLFDRLKVLAEPQQNAMRVAFGISSGAAPNTFLVAVAVLSLLCACAEERPLLCLVDDAQWLDAASLQCLGFVARRLLAEPVAMVFALREPSPPARSTACHSWRSAASTSRTRVPCCREPSRAGSMIASETGSSPRRAEILWRW